MDHVLVLYNRWLHLNFGTSQCCIHAVQETEQCGNVLQVSHMRHGYALYIQKYEVCNWQSGKASIASLAEIKPISLEKYEFVLQV